MHYVSLAKSRAGHTVDADAADVPADESNPETSVADEAAEKQKTNRGKSASETQEG